MARSGLSNPKRTGSKFFFVVSLPFGPALMRVRGAVTGGGGAAGDSSPETRPTLFTAAPGRVTQSVLFAAIFVLVSIGVASLNSPSIVGAAVAGTASRASASSASSSVRGARERTATPVQTDGDEPIAA
ncbi:MAG: hypothetical protein QOE75_1147 [Solirubrobacterales bacterium]|nr:hypothetical protein [Solirubrobacterales bacterium]